jgi:hypothetical protein
MTENQKYKYILVCVDMYDGTIDAEPLKLRDNTNVIKAFKEIFKRKYLDYPLVITLDQGSEFKGDTKAYFESNRTNVNYALTSSDATFLQLHHGLFPNPAQSTIYYFALEPLSGSGITLTTDSAKTGIYSPKTGIEFNRISLTTTVEGTLGTSEPSLYVLYVGGSSVSLPNLIQNQPISSSNTSLNIFLTTLDSRIYIAWRTPAWVTPPTDVSHNIVLYGTRGTANI